jgi:hypothetical protein
MTRPRQSAIAARKALAEENGLILAVALFGLLPLSLATGWLLIEMAAAWLRF